MGRCDRRVRIDGSAPEWVKLSADLLKDSTDQYLFISTRSVYLDTSRVPMTADAPVLTRENAPIADGQAAELRTRQGVRREGSARGDAGTRDGRAAGPHHWPRGRHRSLYLLAGRMRGGEVLVPGDGTDHVQIIDVRDLVEFNVKLVEDST